MNLDPTSVSLLTAVVVVTAGVVFTLETLVRRDEGAGKVWALAFIAGMLSTLSYIVWAYDPDAWWAVGIGNGAFVVTTGCMWLGCRRYNRRSILPAAVAVAVVAMAAYFAVLAAGPHGGGWAGSIVMFVALMVFAFAGAIESMRGDMGGQRTSWGLAIVLAVQGLFYAARIVAFFAAGVDSVLFQQWLGTITANFLTVPLTIVALVVTSVLRAGRADLRGFARRTSETLGADGILPHSVFFAMLTEIAQRAQWRQELVAVVAVRIEDLEQISTAFGSEVARSVRDAWRDGVRRYPPSNAIVGEDGLSGLLLGIIAENPAEARRQAALVYRGVFEDLGAVVGGVIPVVGVGVAMSSTFGYEPSELESAARRAAERATLTVESSVVVGEAA